MSFKEKFNQKEWETIELSVIWMFQAIAGVDKKIDENELTALSVLQSKADKIENELIKEVLSEYKYNVNELSGIFAKESRNIKTGLRDLAEILDNKIDAGEALLFKKSLLAFGMYIAYASGDLISSKMSNEELQTLIELALFMKISISDYREPPTVEELMKDIIGDSLISE